MKITRHRTDPQPCPRCAHVLDACTAPNCERSPKPGDHSVCLYCRSILKFDDALKLQLVSDEEFIELPADLRSDLKRAQDHVTKIAADRAASRSA